LPAGPTLPISFPILGAVITAREIRINGIPLSMHSPGAAAAPRNRDCIVAVANLWQ